MSREPIAIDPAGCGCTECITGEYVPLDQASDAQVIAMLQGRIHCNVGEGTEIRIATTFTVNDRNGFDSVILQEVLR